MSSQARCFENNLQPIDITEEGLRSSLKDIQAHISDAIKLIVHHVENCPLQDERHDSIYTGNAGALLSSLIAHTKLKLHRHYVDVTQACYTTQRYWFGNIPRL